MPAVRILALSRYGPLGASSRVRMLQYIPFLKRRGVEVTVLPLLSDGYVRGLYQGVSPNLLEIAGSYLKRMALLLARDSHRILWVEKECFPWLPYGFERLFLRRRARLVVDYDDAQWLRYQQQASVIVRCALERKIPGIMETADCIVAGNQWLGEIARQAGARKVVIIPSVVDLDRYPATAKWRAGRPCILGWIGSPATAPYVKDLGRCLAELAKRSRIRLVCVGLDRFELPGVEVETRPWSEATEAKEIQSFDIGIMPLHDGLWERGKCGYKLVQYMACGLPVIASAVGANREIVEAGVTGFLARDDREWLQAIDRLMHDPALYAAMSRAARRSVERLYSVQSRLCELEAVLLA